MGGVFEMSEKAHLRDLVLLYGKERKLGDFNPMSAENSKKTSKEIFFSGQLRKVSTLLCPENNFYTLNCGKFKKNF